MLHIETEEKNCCHIFMSPSFVRFWEDRYRQGTGMMRDGMMTI